MSDNNAGELKGRMTLDTSGFKAGVEETKRQSRSVSAAVDSDLKKLAETAHASTSRIGASFMAIGGTMGTLHPTLGRLVSGFTAVKGASEAMGVSFGKAAIGMGAIAGVASAVFAAISVLKNMTIEGIKLAAANEQTAISYEVLTGSVETASKLMRELREFANHTPFRFDEVSSAGKQLLAYGVEAKNITETLRRLGDVSSALNISMGDMAYLYGTAKTQGRLFTQDLNQFTNRGIPMIQELAKQFGVADSEVRKLVEDGKVGFPEVEKAIVSLTSEGGRFFDMTSRQSQSLNGLWSTFKDTVDELKMSLAKGFVGDDAKEAVSEIVAEAEKLKPAFERAGDALQDALKNAIPLAKRLVDHITDNYNFLAGRDPELLGQAAAEAARAARPDDMAPMLQNADAATLGRVNMSTKPQITLAQNAMASLDAMQPWLPDDVKAQIQSIKDRLAQADMNLDADLAMAQDRPGSMSDEEMNKLRERVSSITGALADLQGLFGAIKSDPKTIFRDPYQRQAWVNSGQYETKVVGSFDQELSLMRSSYLELLQNLRVPVVEAGGKLLDAKEAVKRAEKNLEETKARIDPEDPQNAGANAQMAAMFGDEKMQNELNAAEKRLADAKAEVEKLQGSKAVETSTTSSAAPSASTATPSSTGSTSKASGPTTAEESERGRELLAIAEARARGDNDAADRMQARIEILDEAKRKGEKARSLEEVQAIEMEAKRKLAELEQSKQRELYDLQTEAEATRLRSIGKANEAELLEFDARSKRKIEMAQSEAEKLIKTEIWRIEREELLRKQEDEEEKRSGKQKEVESEADYGDLVRPARSKRRRKRTMSDFFGSVKPGKRNPWKSNAGSIFKAPRKVRHTQFMDIFGSDVGRSTLAGAQSALAAVSQPTPQAVIQPIDMNQLTQMLSAEIVPAIDQRIRAYAAAARAAASVEATGGDL